MAGNRRTPASSSSNGSRAPPQAETNTLVFLHHGSSSSSRNQPALTTAARAHASRRGHSKSTAASKRGFRFVSVQGDGTSTSTSTTASAVATPGSTTSAAAADDVSVSGSAAAASNDYGSSVAANSRQGSLSSTISGRTSTPPLEAAIVPAHEFRHHDFHLQQQQQHSIVVIDSSGAIVTAAGEVNPPRSLSADSWDPFDSLSVHNLSHSEQFMLHYGKLFLSLPLGFIPASYLSLFCLLVLHTARLSLWKVSACLTPGMLWSRKEGLPHPLTSLSRMVTDKGPMRTAQGGLRESLSSWLDLPNPACLGNDWPVQQTRPQLALFILPVVPLTCT